MTVMGASLRPAKHRFLGAALNIPDSRAACIEGGRGILYTGRGRFGSVSVS